MSKPQNNRVLVRFHTKQSKVRDAIMEAFGIQDAEVEKVTRETLRRINEHRQDKAKQLGLKQARPGILGDNGTQVFGEKGLCNVSLAELHTDLIASGLILIGASVTQSPQMNQEEGAFTATNKQKWVIDAEYHLPEEGLEQNPELVKRVEAFLASKRIYQIVHVWDNPDGSATVNAMTELDREPANPNVLRYHPRRGFRSEDVMSAPPQGMSLTQKLKNKIEAATAKSN